MATLERMAKAAVERESLLLRSLTQDFLEQNADLSVVSMPGIANPVMMAAAASLVELLAERRKQKPPKWAETIGPSPQTIYLLREADKLPRLRALCEAESPPELRKRGFLAPPGFLESA